MVWKKLVGIICCMVAVGVAVVTLAVPRSDLQTAEMPVTDGTDGALRVSLPVRGWTDDWMPVSLDLSTLAKQNAQTTITIRVQIDLIGADLDPRGDISSVITPGNSAKFNWKMRAVNKGQTQGTIWVFAGENGKDEQLLFGREFKYDSLYYAFIPPLTARILAGVLLLAGLLLIFIGNKRGIKQSR